MKKQQDTLLKSYVDSDLIIGLVGAVGTRLVVVAEQIKKRLEFFGYKSAEIRISKQLIPLLIKVPKDSDFQNSYDRINTLMTAGNEARTFSNNNAIFALGSAVLIGSERKKHPHEKRMAFIINSLKRPEEVAKLREIYSDSFYLLGVYSDKEIRKKCLCDEQGMSQEEAEKLIKRDAEENILFGQGTSDTFHRSDFFIPFDDESKMKSNLWRILDILFGDPFQTPTFDEFAMFMAFSAALRSADLSRQVGAVIAKKRQIIAMGANDAPAFGGGLYWTGDDPDGRDYKVGYDSNKINKDIMINEIISKCKFDTKTNKILKNVLNESKIQDITEYGRVVHAEMEALLSCSRSNNNSQDGVLYCTTFPCHNCAKHIVAAGITKVVYVEPYPKSKTEEMYPDSVNITPPSSEVNAEKKVSFEPFVGVGPRRFFDFFSMQLSSGYPLQRKETDGKKIVWKRANAVLRTKSLPLSYLDMEKLAINQFNMHRKELKDDSKK
ncbi:deaminase [bacterium]|nr:deaminase [bacterium]